MPWRKDSFLDDGQDVRHDLSGGYFDAGDYVKFNFPQAAATTVLAWGMVEFENGYRYAGQHEKGLATIKWATDYFLKSHTGKAVCFKISFLLIKKLDKEEVLE